MRTIYIKPDPDCKYCGGSGQVYDSVECWGYNCSMPSLCDCVENKLPPDFQGDVEIDLSDFQDERCKDETDN